MLRILLLFILTTIIIPVPADSSPHQRGLATHAILVRWVDGDTLVAQTYRSGQTHVRLIGIDAPETTPNSRAAYQAQRLGVSVQQILALGQAARAYAARLAPPGSPITLELDVQTHDRYGRLLAYVWVGNILLNREIARSGYACPLTIPPNVRHAHAIAHAARKASQEGRSICW